MRRDTYAPIRKFCTLEEGGEWIPYNGQEQIKAFAFEWEGQLIVYDYVLKAKGHNPLRLADVPAPSQAWWSDTPAHKW